MRIFQLRFRPKNGDLSPQMQRLLNRFRLQLVRNGLILEGTGYSYIESGELVWNVAAQDDSAIAEENMTYDTRQALGELLKWCDGLPQVIPMQECCEIPHCTCSNPGTYVLQSPAEWAGTPVRCVDCGGSVPLYRLVRDREQREFDDLLHWRKLRRGFLEQIGEKLNTGYAYGMLNDCRSGLAQEGRRLAATVQRWTGVVTLYPVFSRFEEPPRRCPGCGGDWRNPYIGAIPYKYFCRQCRLVLTDEV